MKVKKNNSNNNNKKNREENIVNVKIIEKLFVYCVKIIFFFWDNFSCFVVKLIGGIWLVLLWGVKN